MSNGIWFALAILLFAGATRAGPASSRLRISPDFPGSEKFTGAIGLWNENSATLAMHGYCLDISGFFSSGDRSSFRKLVQQCVSGHDELCHAIECPEKHLKYLHYKRYRDDANPFDARNIRGVDVDDKCLDTAGGRMLIPEPALFVRCLASHYQNNPKLSYYVSIGGHYYQATTPQPSVAVARIDEVPQNRTSSGYHSRGDGEQYTDIPGGAILYDPKSNRFTIEGKTVAGPIDRPVKRDTSINAIGVAASTEWRQKIFRKVDQALARYSEWLTVERPDSQAIRSKSDNLRSNLYAITNQKESGISNPTPFGAHADQSPFDALRERTKDYRDQFNAKAKEYSVRGKETINGPIDLLAGAAIVAGVTYIKHGPIASAAAALFFYTMLEPSSVSSVLIGVISLSIFYIRRYPLYSSCGLIYGFGLYEGILK